MPNGCSDKKYENFRVKMTEILLPFAWSNLGRFQSIVMPRGLLPEIQQAENKGRRQLQVLLQSKS
jgi:hypothetical protein